MSGLASLFQLNAVETAGKVVLIVTVCQQDGQDVNAIHYRQGKKDCPIFLFYLKPCGKFFVFHWRVILRFRNYSAFDFIVTESGLFQFCLRQRDRILLNIYTFFTDFAANAKSWAERLIVSTDYNYFTVLWKYLQPCAIVKTEADENMGITSFYFLCFFTVLLIVYYWIPRKLQWGLLLLGSVAYCLACGAGNPDSLSACVRGRLAIWVRMRLQGCRRRRKRSAGAFLR